MVVYTDTPVAEENPNQSTMAHWLHCNACLCFPLPNVSFYLTNCSHIFCSQCVQSCTHDKCKVCGSICKTLLLNEKINKEIESLFIDPVETCRRQLKKVEQVLDFQKNHQRRLVKQLKAKNKALESHLMSAKDAMKNRIQAIEREFLRLKSENEYLKLLVSKKDSHPRCKSTISPQTFGASSGRMTYDLNHQRRCQASNNQEMASTFCWRTPPSALRSSNSTPTAFDAKGFPNTIPRPIVFPKSN